MIAIAGTWTATGWPVTMKSAARSGRAAVEHLDAGGSLQRLSWEPRPGSVIPERVALVDRRGAPGRRATAHPDTASLGEE